MAAMVYAGASQATILTFDQGQGNSPTPLDHTYGDNVAAATMGTFTYGVGGEGFTPNVTAAYASADQTDMFNIWHDGYGDLFQALENARNSNSRLDVILTAAAGFEVRLFDMDLGGWFQTDHSVASITVYDETLAVLFSENDVHVEGDNGHTSLSFGGLEGQILLIRLEINLGIDSDLVGIDNLRFGQFSPTAAAPEPMSMALLGFGLAGLGAARLRRRR